MKHIITETYQGVTEEVAAARTPAVAHIIAQALRKEHYKMGDKAPTFAIIER